jgi:methylenetetrahydrofolate dehydrogenase (NADP+)/methenyltetrahydrofolate cyclohydrolase
MGETKGKHTVVIGRSHIVGRPMSILMGRKGFQELNSDT